ncbi:hypothetical protein AV530_003843 [Patagioenas fasciata monilis]|uniref:Uncharacterized protein n=1 Tax=Patagioenas fasciata monilis TaxID=372326 RepID=A0A1V4KZ18_PATFA|nr:hypothetical protein AV530_003843 [Patagioenas fasciata monilis]
MEEPGEKPRLQQQHCLFAGGRHQIPSIVSTQIKNKVLFKRNHQPVQINRPHWSHAWARSCLVTLSSQGGLQITSENVCRETRISPPFIYQ